MLAQEPSHDDKPHGCRDDREGCIAQSPFMPATALGDVQQNHCQRHRRKCKREPKLTQAGKHNRECDCQEEDCPVSCLPVEVLEFHSTSCIQRFTSRSARERRIVQVVVEILSFGDDQTVEHLAGNGNILIVRAGCPGVDPAAGHESTRLLQGAPRIVRCPCEPYCCRRRV